MVFEKRKIQFETLGEYLGEVRRSLNLSLETVSEKTEVKINFLKNLEAGKYELLPPDVYVLGFISRLAGLYALDAKILILQYKKEKNIHCQLEKNQEKKHGWKKRLLEKFVITPKSLSLLAGLILFFASLAYIVWQVFSINRIPALEIYQPTDRQVVRESFVKVLGKTDPGMSVTVNGQSLFVNQDGKFETQVGISTGPQEINISSKNRFDKVIVKTVSIIGSPESFGQKLAGVSIKLEFTGPVELIFSSDEDAPQTQTFNSGESKEIFAVRKAVISSSDGGVTSLTLNGKAMGMLGRKGEKISNMSFFPESGNQSIKP